MYNSEIAQTPSPPPLSGILTPPWTGEKPVPTASTAVAALLRFCKACQKGYAKQHSWTRFSINPLQYAEFERFARRDSKLWDYLEEKLRFDYDASKSNFVVRMPLNLHESFLQQVCSHIESQLDRFKKQSIDRNNNVDTILRTWAEKLVGDRSADIRLDLADITPDRSKQSPDTSYAHRDAKFPGLVIEVSYSQKAKDLPKLADNYILGSNGNIKMVLGLDLDYKRGSSLAKAYVWRPKFTSVEGDEGVVIEELSTQLVYEKLFRDDEGLPITDFSLTLKPGDFCPRERLPGPQGLPPDLQKSLLETPESAFSPALVIIGSEQFCEFLDLAEHRAEMVVDGVEDVLSLNARKRKMSSSPVEELSIKDEITFRSREEQAAARVSDNDSDYHPFAKQRRTSRTRAAR